jgi:16S rRNA C1402 (ribose-2'-O) methylase RsmI
MLRRVVWQKFTDVSEVLTASIIRAMIALIIEAARTSETLVNFYQTTRRYNPEHSHLRTHRLENLISYLHNLKDVCILGCCAV